jgi:hypothetical protein
MFWVRFFLFLSLVLTPSLSPSFAQPSSHSECEKIWKRLQSGRFHELRNLIHYENSLGSQFYETLRRLRPNQIWLDAGSGQTIAVTDYLHEFPQGATAMGVTIKPIEDAERIHKWQVEQKRLQMWVGVDFLEIDPQALGRPDLITDFLGVASYTDRLDQTLQTYVDILQDQGEIYLLIEVDQTQIFTSTTDHPLKLNQWLRQIPGLRVEAMNLGVYKITKTQSAVKIPKLALLNIQDDQPPLRTYRILESSDKLKP